MPEKEPLFQESGSYTPPSSEIESYRRDLLDVVFSILYSVVASFILYLIFTLLLSSIIPNAQFYYESLLLGAAALLFLLSVLSIGFGSSPSIAGFWASLTRSRRKITPAGKTLKRGIIYLLMGIILVVFASMTV